MARYSAAAMAMVALGLDAVPAYATEVPPHPGDLLARMEGLRTVGSLLYVAAHPDDENTRFLAWVVGERHLDATYLSLTRGGGGQNLVGTEQSELLGVLRTGELLGARRIDGAQQRFTRARDFGYSKSADEALEQWGHDEVLDDVVRTFRTVRPDVVVTRFGVDDDTHGHHVASARLAREAFDLAGDPAYVTDGLAPWQPRRLLRNAASWHLPDDADLSSYLSADLGGYDALRGRSWGEVAADARTQHKSQGFGSAPSVGPKVEYFSGTAGDLPAPGDDLFEGLALDWSRVPGAGPLDRTLKRAIEAFDPRHPEASLPLLARAHAQLGALEGDGWPAAKRVELEALMADIAGLWLTARSEAPAVASGLPADLALEALVRVDVPVHLEAVTVGGERTVVDTPLSVHTPWQLEASVPTEGLDVTRPHWLAEAPSPTRYTVPVGDGRTAADTAPPLVARFELRIADTPVRLDVPVLHAWTDPVQGERLHPVEILPPATATFGQRTRLLPAGSTVTVPLTLRATAGQVAGTLRLTGPEGATVTPATLAFELPEGAPEQVVPVEVTVGATRGPLVATLEVGGVSSSWSRTVIDHPHVPRRTVLAPAALDLVPVALDRGGVDRIAYLPGPGDTVAEALRDLGYAVDRIDLDTVRSGGLDAWPTVVIGIRAMNADDALLEAQPALYAYVERGGRLVMQYHTSNRWRDLGALGPEPFHIDRGRVTDESAALEPIDPDARVLHHPNALGPDDYAGWVQERGLYFADRWHEAYRPVFRTHDPGEEPLEGSVLILPHGEGTFVYTGLSFFRQLPAGVPGAARLLANLLAVDAAEGASE